MSEVHGIKEPEEALNDAAAKFCLILGQKSWVIIYLSSNISSGFNFFFSICCFAKSAVNNANAPPVMLAIPNIAVPLKTLAIVMPKVPVARPHGILLFIFIVSDLPNV